MVKSLQSESTCKVYHSSLFYVKLNGIFVPILSHDKEGPLFTVLPQFDIL